MKNEDNRSTFDAEQEILAILSQVHVRKPETTASSETTEVNEEDTLPAIPASPDTTATDIPLILSPDTEESVPVPAKKAGRRKEKAPAHAAAPDAKALITNSENEEEGQGEVSPFSCIGKGISKLFPHKEDPTSEIVRKCVFLFSLLVFLVSLGFLTYYMVLEPNEVNKENDTYASLFNDTDGNQKAETNNETQNIQQSFRQLYNINKDIAGWLAYNSTDSDKFMKINLPVVWCGNNDTYLSRGFDGKYSRSGTLFFEQTNSFTENASNKVTIIYGHNMASGAMFAPLNKLIGNLYRARSAATMKLDTLYNSNQYKVFAVIVSDEGAKAAHRFGYLRTAFADDTDFMNYVDELRARSLFDYPVDVQPSDELLILSTCTNKSQVKVADGRFAIIARRVREGEVPTVDTAKIVKNEDVIMPYAWYTAQSLTPHDFYTKDDFTYPEVTTAVQTTTQSSTDETTTAGEATTTITQNTTVNVTSGESDKTTDTTVQTTNASTTVPSDDTSENTTTATHGTTTTSTTP